MRIVMFIGCFIGLGVLGEEPDLRITYISADTVFVDGGREAGLAIGDKLRVVGDSTTLAELEVTELSQRAASCRILSKTGTIKVGDRAIRVPPENQIEAKVEVEEPREPVPSVSTPRPQRSQARPPEAQFSGTLSLQYFQWIDESPAGNDFSQPGLRLNLRGENLFGGDYRLRIRTRTRYQQRDRPVNSLVPETEWKNRIYEASLSYEPEAGFWHYRVGRIIANAFGGVGYIDGGLLAINPSSHNQFGLFAGTQPEWLNSDVTTSLTKYGTYYQFQRGSYQTSRFESTLALAGEYHGSTVNREFAYIRNQYSLGRRVTFFQSAEIEINRDWRREKAGRAWDLTNLNAYGRFQVGSDVYLGLSYDDRKNYYTYELRNRDDLYFDDLTRRGFRLTLQGKLPAGIRFNGQYGLRSREGDDEDTRSYMFHFYRGNFPAKGWSAALRLSGFENPLTEGFNPSIRIGKRLGNRGSTVYFGYAGYQYTFLSNDSERDTEWFRLEHDFMLGRKLFWTGQYEYNTGDDAEGFRLFFSLGYRL